MSTLPTHPRTGRRAVGWRKPRQGEIGAKPIWPIAGGSGEGDPPPAPAPTPPPVPPTPPTPPEPDDKTDWKSEARKWEQRAKDNKGAADEAVELKARLDKLSPLEKLAEALAPNGAKDPSDLEKLTERISKHEDELASERLARYRAEVANEKGLPSPLAARLTGTTREELAADADELLKLLPSTPEKGQRPGYVGASGTGEHAPAKGSVAAGRELFKAARPKAPAQI